LISCDLKSYGLRISSFAAVAKQIVTGSARLIISFRAEAGANVVSNISRNCVDKLGLLASAHKILESSCGL
jgi:molybdopterin-binding protein